MTCPYGQCPDLLAVTFGKYLDSEIQHLDPQDPEVSKEFKLPACLESHKTSGKQYDIAAFMKLVEASAFLGQPSEHRT